MGTMEVNRRASDHAPMITAEFNEIRLLLAEERLEEMETWASLGWPTIWGPGGVNDRMKANEVKIAELQTMVSGLVAMVENLCENWPSDSGTAPAS